MGQLSILFAKRNRGLLLDLFIFLLNIFLIRLLTRQTLDLFRAVDEENPAAQLSLGLMLAAMWLLPVSGAVLKRWRFHQRREAKKLDWDEIGLGGCLFNPLFYFCLNLVISAAVLAALGNFLFGNRALDNPWFFIPTIFAILILTIIQTYLIYSYFSKPAKPPRWKFLMTEESETLGDICLFLNMILFQIFWNMLTFGEMEQPREFAEFCGRLFILCFLALLIYFPPRMFYLAEDIHRRRTWLTMLLANSPVIIRALIGTHPNYPNWN